MGGDRTLLAALSAVLNAAVTDGLISRNPCAFVKPPRAEHARVQPWTGEQVSAVRGAMPTRYQALADVGAGLGLRQGEAFGLAVDDVDFMHRVVHVRRQVRIVGNQMTFAPPKGGKERDVPLPESVALRLSAHIAAYPPVPVELPWKVPDGKPVMARLVFTAPGGAALHRSSFNAVAWQPALRGAGLPCSRGNGMHALRHYFASACQVSGVASDASFGSSRKHALPAAQRAALRCSRPAGARAASVTWDFTDRLDLMQRCCG